MLLLNSLRKMVGRTAAYRWGLRRPAGRSRRAGFVSWLEALEDRTVPSTFAVENLLDSGPGSLRQAVLAANGNPGPDVVRFARGLEGTITLTGGQLSITDD